MGEVRSGFGPLYFASVDSDGECSEMVEVGKPVSMDFNGFCHGETPALRREWLSDGESGSITVKLPWYWQNTPAYRLAFGSCFGYRKGGSLYPRYTVPKMRRYGKSHRRVP